jgi:DNA-binding SARP family transcriptional activator
MDGLDVVIALQRDCPSIPVIFVAVAPTTDLIVSAFRSGARDFVEKPFDSHTMLECVNRILSTSGNNATVFPPETGSTPVPYRKLQTLVPPAPGFTKLWPKQLRGFISRLFSVRANNRPGRWSLIAKSATAKHPHDRLSPTNKGNNQFHHSNQESHREPGLRVQCLGTFTVIVNGVAIEQWPSRKGKALSAYLAFHHTRRIYREVLMDKFWPRSSPDSARNCLNVALHGVRRLFHRIDPAHEYILFKDECYFINPEIEVWLDVEEFVRRWRVAQSIERESGLANAVGEYELAAALYKGDFMEDDVYESWPSTEREHFKEIYLVILDRLSKHYSSDSDPATAISLCELILQKDNCREDIHRRLMRCYYTLGQRDKALRQFRKCRDALRQELEIDPTGTTLELYAQIKGNF